MTSHHEPSTENYRQRHTLLNRQSIVIQMTVLALSLCSGASQLIASKWIPLSLRSSSSTAFAALPTPLFHGCPVNANAVTSATARFSSTDTTIETSSENSNISNGENIDENNETKYIPPWSLPSLKSPTSKSIARFRQHVNPLSRRFQMPTDLPENWPNCDYDDVNLPLYLDIGCGKGGFLLDLVGRRHGSTMVGSSAGEEDGSGDKTSQWLPTQVNYLGLEIRPGVSQYAQARVQKRGLSGKLSFVGCNANVDLDRLLALYQEAAGGSAHVNNEDGKNNRLAFVSIQFPDPHFKKQHSKRRVVTPSLVSSLAKFMQEGDVVFLQSDVKDVLVDMRERFCEDDGKLHFVESENYEEEFSMENPLGVPTEREVSVLNKDLPVFRALFRRNSVSL